MSLNDLPGVFAPGARRRLEPFCDKIVIYYNASVGAMAVNSNRVEVEYVHCVWMAIDAVVADRQNSRVARCSLKLEACPSAAFPLGALAQVYKREIFATSVLLLHTMY